MRTVQNQLSADGTCYRNFEEAMARRGLRLQDDDRKKLKEIWKLLVKALYQSQGRPVQLLRVGRGVHKTAVPDEHDAAIMDQACRKWQVYKIRKMRKDLAQVNVATPAQQAGREYRLVQAEVAVQPDVVVEQIASDSSSSSSSASDSDS